jgi:non-ribosomal peptide synthetase component F
MTAQDPANGLACAGDEAAGEVATALERARGPRVELRASMDALERAAAAPAPHRLEQWAMAVHDALADIAAAFERHIAVTEGPEGLLAEIEQTEPRLVTYAVDIGAGD